MKKTLIALSVIMATMSCTNKNPFFAEWDTPYGIPDFGQIKATSGSGECSSTGSTDAARREAIHGKVLTRC